MSSPKKPLRMTALQVPLSLESCCRIIGLIASEAGPKLGPWESSDAFEFHDAARTDDEGTICSKMPLGSPFINFQLDSKFRSSDHGSSSSTRIIPFRYVASLLMQFIIFVTRNQRARCISCIRSCQINPSKEQPDPRRAVYSKRVERSQTLCCCHSSTFECTNSEGISVASIYFSTNSASFQTKWASPRMKTFQDIVRATIFGNTENPSSLLAQLKPQPPRTPRY